MTWPPALMESSGGHAEGADTRTRGHAARGVSKATQGKHAGLVKEGKENIGRQTEVRGIRPTGEQRTGDGPEVRTQG